MKHLYDEAPKVVLAHPNAIMPTRAHEHDAGWDLYAIEEQEIRPGHVARVRTGINIGVPIGQVGDIRPRSGMASRGITVANSPGTIDAGFTGEIIVLLINHGYDRLHIEPGDRIAQIVFTYTNTQPLTQVEALDPSARGTDGFGSTGN